jgi:hypothetical protein
MRRCAALLTAVSCAAALAVSGCGGGGEAASPLDEGLGYLPPDASFAVAIDTDLDGAQYRELNRIAGDLGLEGQVEGALRQLLEAGDDVDFERDVKPVLGNPFVVGAPSARSVTDGQDESEFVGAIQARDEEALQRLVDKSRPREAGERSGATLYRDSDGDTFAVKEDVLIVANSEPVLEQALDRREGDERFGEDDFDRGLDGLPDEALVRVYADVQGLLDSDPDTRSAQRVPWVNGLRTLGLTAAAEDDGVSVDYLLRTEDVEEQDLPIASGDESPGVVRRSGEVAVAIRDLRQVVEFGEAAARAVNPESFRDYEAGKEQIDTLLGVNLDRDVIAQLTGDTAASFTVDGRFAIRAELEDAEAFKQTLEKASDVLPRLAEGIDDGEYGLERPEGAGGLYRLTDSNGRSYFFGVVDQLFVLDSSAAGARRLAAASPEQVAGARGSVASIANAEQLVEAALTGFGTQFGLPDGRGDIRDIPLGEIVSSTSASPDGLRGSILLGVD